MEGEDSKDWDIEYEGQELIITTCFGKKCKEIFSKVQSFLDRKMFKIDKNEDIPSDKM